MNIIITFLPFLQSLIKPEQIENNLKEFIKPLDMVGLNYGMHLTESLHKVNPGRIIVHSETFPRSIGKTWPITLKNKHAVGDFMWTGWDYLGEVGIGVVQYGRQPKRFNKPYPCIGGGVGSVNLAGFIEGQGHYTAVVFGVEKHPYIGVRPLNHAGEKSQMGQWRGTDVVNSWSWTGCEGKMAEIEVFSDEAQIELILNNKSLGKQPVVDYTARFKTIYQPGLLQAIAYNSQGTKVSSSSLSTASDKTVITVCSEKSKISADGNDLAYINISLTDEDGIVKVLEDRKIKVNVVGNGILQAVGSGNPITSESYVGTSFTTYQGRMVAVVRSTCQPGIIKIIVSADDMDAKEIEIISE